MIFKTICYSVQSWKAISDHGIVDHSTKIRHIKRLMLIINMNNKLLIGINNILIILMHFMLYWSTLAELMEDITSHIFQMEKIGSNLMIVLLKKYPNFRSESMVTLIAHPCMALTHIFYFIEMSQLLKILNKYNLQLNFYKKLLNNSRTKKKKL
jgi:hypothetical protein